MNVGRAVMLWAMMCAVALVLVGVLWPTKNTDMQIGADYLATQSRAKAIKTSLDSALKDIISPVRH